MSALAETYSWTEDFIWIWLPLPRAEAYYHWVLRSRGYKTYLPPEDAKAQVKQLAEAPGISTFMQPIPELDALVSRFFPDVNKA